ncbi:hypothetical protein EV383_5716 [Pseudonocardia sediminis]|uniref:Uncharacterized protein n=1 Tax=Pseudonocardia sediminis TaxID=1397368 RepID=A0A4V2FRJ3_PSEST|nr:hypothetical protein EV383_5716 [Pseudonocardia sediminis]
MAPGRIATPRAATSRLVTVRPILEPNGRMQYRLFKVERRNGRLPGFDEPGVTAAQHRRPVSRRAGVFPRVALAVTTAVVAGAGWIPAADCS